MPGQRLGPAAGIVAAAPLRSLRASKADASLEAGNSFLRQVDPRVKIALALAASAAVALPLTSLALVAACLTGLLAGGRLTGPAVAQLWRARVWLAVLFLIDWLVVGVGFAVLITLRLTTLAAAFTIVFATTTADELALAVERLGVPRRLAFAFAMAFRVLGLVEREWREIVEAQHARGIVLQASGTRRWRAWREHLAHAAALVVPAIVLAVQRAWAINEAAAVRGFESPAYRPYQVLRLRPADHALLMATAVVLGGAFLLR
jgi:energy-coupling factor transporter transmembrane protein EcfT